VSKVRESKHARLWEEESGSTQGISKEAEGEGDEAELESAAIVEAQNGREKCSEESCGPEHLKAAAGRIDRDNDTFERELYAEALDWVAEEIDQNA